MNCSPLILVSLPLAAFVINLDTRILNVALSSLVRVRVTPSNGTRS
jgi:hypothetical protein